MKGWWTYKQPIIQRGDTPRHPNYVIALVCLHMTPLRLGKVVSLSLFLAIQAALPTKSFIGQDAKCFKAVQGYIST